VTKLKLFTYQGGDVKLFKIKSVLTLLCAFSLVLLTANYASASIFSQIFGSNKSDSQTQVSSVSSGNATSNYQQWSNNVDALLNSLSSNNAASANSSSTTNNSNNTNSSLPLNTSEKAPISKQVVQTNSTPKINTDINTTQTQTSPSTTSITTTVQPLKITDGDYPPVNLMKNQFINDVKLYNDGTKTILLIESTTPISQADIKQFAFPDQVIIDIPNIFLDKTIKTGQFTPKDINYVNMFRIQNFDSDILKSSRIVLTFPDAPNYTILKTDDPRKIEIAFVVPSLDPILKKNEKTSKDITVNSSNIVSKNSVNIDKN
jgi:hypothetical protein